MKRIISILIGALMLLSMSVMAGAALAPTEYEYTDIASDQNTYSAGDVEMYTTNARHMSGYYSTSGGTNTNNSTVGTTVKIDTNADGVYDAADTAWRYILTKAGASGDPVYMNYGVPSNAVDNGGNNPGCPYKSFDGYAGSHANVGLYWDMTNIVKGKIYQFTLRAKAPAYITDSTMESENVLYVDKVTGSVKVKSDKTNGMIGAPLGFRINTNKSNPNTYGLGTFTGYLDEAGNYVPFTAQGAKYTQACLQSEYVDYVGYFVATGQTKDATVPISQDTIIFADSEGEGLWYIDEVSMKEMTFTNGNLAQNGNFSIVNGNQALLYESDDTTVANDGTHGNILNVAQGAETKEVPVVDMISETEYTISFYAKSSAANGTAYANIIADSVPIQLKDDMQVLTTDWQKYEFDFTYTGGKLDFSIGADCNGSYSIADIRILPKATAINNKFTNISISGNLIENHTISVDFTYVTDETPYYIVKISRGDDATGTIVLEESVNAQSSVNYTVSSADIGKRLCVEVFAMGETMTVSKIVSNIVVPEVSIVPEFTGYNFGSRTLSAKVTIINNYVTDDDLELFIALAVYDATKRKVCNIVYLEDVAIEADTGANIKTISAVIPSEKLPDTAKLFVWSGSDIYDADMTALTKVLTYNNFD